MTGRKRGVASTHLDRPRQAAPDRNHTHTKSKAGDYPPPPPKLCSDPIARPGLV